MPFLEKDPSILQLLDGLSGSLGATAFDIVDHWEYDLCAVGIASPRNHGVLAYLSTYNLEPGRYDVELELHSDPGSDLPYRRAGVHSDVDFATVVKIVGQHLASAN